MGQLIAITRTEHSASDFRRLTSRELDGQVLPRLLALAMVLEGHSRTDAAQMNGMDQQTLRDWVHRYNPAGVSGLISRLGAGPTPILNEVAMAELRALVRNGPDPATDEVVRWRYIALRDKTKSLCN
jgi:transposase